MHTKVEDAVIDMRRMPCSQKRNAHSQERTKILKMWIENIFIVFVVKHPIQKSKNKNFVLLKPALARERST